MLSASQLAGKQGYRDLHTAVEVRHDGGEDGRSVQPGDVLHLRKMLVALRETVLTGAVQVGGAIAALVLGDHLPASAGIARQGEAGEKRVPGDQPAAHQRRNQRDEPAGMAAGNGHMSPVDNAVPVLAGQLREAVGPALRSAVGGGCIQNAGFAALGQGHGFPGGGVGQAENCHVGGVDAFLPGGGILASAFFEGDEVHVRPVSQPVEDPQPRGAVLAVDENVGRHDKPPRLCEECE